MSRGNSGRIVIEVDPALKRNLYLSIELKQKTLKDWFVDTASNYIDKTKNIDILVVAEKKAKYDKDNK